MAYIPYSCQNVDESDIAAVVAVLRSEFLTQGPAVARFESAFAKTHAVPHAVAVANATCGLHIACLALGVGPGSRVWTSPNSFLASANCALYCGATVDFVDIDPASRNMSVAALRARLNDAASCDQLPQVLIPVDFSGLPCDLREMRELAALYGFRILEDASHATGASYLGRPVGSQYADISVFSLHAVKVITSAEGGIVTTRDAALDRQLRLLRSHGMTREPEFLHSIPDGPWVYEQHLLGFNYRLTDMQAALGESQLKRLTAMHKARQTLARNYDELLATLPLHLPIRSGDRESSCHLYVVEIDDQRCSADRGHVFAAMRRAHIGVNVHYIPIYLQPYYAALGFRRGLCPLAEHYYARALSLPLFPAMTTAQQEQVVDALASSLVG